MAYVYNAITEGGFRVSAQPNGDIVFNPPFALPPIVPNIGTQLLFLRALDIAVGINRVVIAVGKAHDGDSTVLVNDRGATTSAGTNFGNQAHDLWVDGDGALWVVFVVYGAVIFRRILDPFTLTLGPSNTYLYPIEPDGGFPSEGFLWVIGMGQVAWTHENRVHVLGGEPLLLPYRSGDWECGQHSNPDGVFAYNHAEGKLYQAWLGSTQVPSRINAQGTLAVSAEPDRPLFVTRDQFVPFVKPAPVPVVEPYDEPKAVGPFWGSSEQYGYHEFSGNYDMVMGPYATYPASDFNKLKIKRPIIAGWGALNIPDDMLIGYLADLEFPETLRPDKPAFWYWDAREYQDDDRIRDWDVRLFQAYPNPGEDPAAFEASMHHQLDRFTGNKMIVTAFYTRLGTIDPLLYMVAYDRLLRRPDVMGMMCFDYARSGIKFDPNLLAWYNAFSAATPGLPSFTPQQEKPVAIKTTISHLVSSFPNEDFDSAIETRPGYTTGPWEMVEIVKNSDGTYSIKNNKGTEWLSIQPNGKFESRPVSDPSMPREWEKFDRKGNTLVERNKDQFGGFIPPTRPPVTFLVAGSL